jgi:threonine dehydrogenase-like Zn-dependent dehydrogenase
MRALLIHPGEAGSAEVAQVSDARAEEGRLLLRSLEVGVCGTDREIAEGLFGSAPEGEERLVLGHESLLVVERDGAGFSRGDLVAATVRRSCGQCSACAAGYPDACLTGRYTERGITRLHGFASELVVEDPEHVVGVPPSLGRLGVLAEPGSVCARGLRHAQAIGNRQPWEPSRALVLGAGAIGMLSTYFLRLAGYDVWAAARGPIGSDKGELVQACGAHYVSTGESTIEALAADTGGFDVVIEATGDADVMAQAIAALRRSGVACLLGLDARPRQVSIDGRLLGVDLVIQNRAVFGSVNAHRTDWEAAIANLDQARERWPEAMERFVGLRVPLDRFRDAFEYRGVKATLLLGEA